MALKQASAFRAAQINEQIAAEDVRQARAAFYPRIGIAPNFIYTTPSLSRTAAAVVTNGNVTAVTERNAVKHGLAFLNLRRIFNDKCRDVFCDGLSSAN